MSVFLLMVGDDGVLLVSPQNRTPRTEPFFVAGANDDAFSDVKDALQTLPHTPVYILADTLAQEFRRETLPPLGWFDRQKLKARRLKQTFPHATLTTAVAMRRASVLFSCVHKESPVTLWLELLEGLSNPFEGTAFLPLESADMIPRLRPEAANGWGLLLSAHRTGGLRQIVTKDGELVFSRLTPPLPQDQSAAYAAATLTLDLKATCDYLARLGLKDAASLKLIAVLPNFLHAAVATLPFGIPMVLTPHEAARRLGLFYGALPEDPYSDALHAAWFLHKFRPRALVVPPELRARKITRHARRTGRMAIAALWLSVFLSFAWNGQDTARQFLANYALGKEIHALQIQSTTERAALPSTSVPLGRLRQAIERRRLFTAQHPTPWPTLASVRAVLFTTNSRVLSLVWRHEDSESLELTLREDEGKPENREATIQKLHERLKDRVELHIKQGAP